jgi:hypothetical protein
MRDHRGNHDQTAVTLTRKRELERRWRSACEGSGFCRWVDTASGWTAAVPEVESVTLGEPTSITVQLLPGQIPEDLDALARRLSYALGFASLSVTELGHMWVRLDFSLAVSAAPSPPSAPPSGRPGPSPAWTARRHPELGL